MAKGDKYEVYEDQYGLGTGVYKEPSMSASSAGIVRNGEVIVEIESKTAEGKNWVKFDRGWVVANHLKKIYSAETGVSTTEDNSPPPEDPNNDEEGFGYQPSTQDILAFNNDSIDDSDFVNIKSITGVFGLPYQFLPNTDPRLSQSQNSQHIGYEYAEKIVEKIPLLFLAPGKASFMTKYSKKNKENVLEKLIGLGTGTDDNKNSLNDLITSDGRYYTFEYDPTRYYKFVNPMCRIAARYMNLQDVVINGEHLDNINWENFTRSGIKSIGDFGTYTSIPFYVDAETSIHESFGNSTTQSMMVSTVNSISDMGKELNFLLGSAASLTGVDALARDPDMATNIQNVQDTISKLMGSGNFLSNLSKHLGTVAAGGKLIFPEIWADSNLSRSYGCTLKFISPDASNLSVYLNVIVPLLHLMALVAPQSLKDNPNAYINPFLVRGIYKGFFNVDMGIITSMSVTKGAECQWTPEGIPTSIEVSIEIKDLYNVLTITNTDSTKDWKFDTLNNTALMDYIANLCGINIYKPEISRMIEMWYVNNFENRVTDFFKVNIWSGMQQKVQNFIMRNIFR